MPFYGFLHKRHLCSCSKHKGKIHRPANSGEGRLGNHGRLQQRQCHWGLDLMVCHGSGGTGAPSGFLRQGSSPPLKALFSSPTPLYTDWEMSQTRWYCSNSLDLQDLIHRSVSVQCMLPFRAWASQWEGKKWRWGRGAQEELSVSDKVFISCLTQKILPRIKNLIDSECY